MFKVGDKVRFRRESEMPTQRFGNTFTVKCTKDDGIRAYLFEFDDKVGGDICGCGERHTWVERADDIEIISSVDLNMALTLKDKFAVAFKGEPQKSFIKAGVMNTDESLTPDGQALFLAYLLKEHGAKFKTDIVDPILAEEEKKA